MAETPEAPGTLASLAQSTVSAGSGSAISRAQRRRQQSARMRHQIVALVLSFALMLQLTAPLMSTQAAPASDETTQTAQVAPEPPANTQAPNTSGGGHSNNAKQPAATGLPAGAGIMPQSTILPSGDSLTVNYGDGSSFTDVDNLTPTANKANWDISGGTRQIQIQAAFANQGTAGSRTITVQVPRGFKIQAYTAKSGTAAISGVSQIALSSESDAKLASSTLTALDGSGFAAQRINGYTGQRTSVDTAYRPYDGKVTYSFNSNCDNITLTLTLALDPLLFPYNATTTVLPDITVAMVNGTNSMTLNNGLTITATGLVVPNNPTVTSSYLDNGATRQVAGVVNPSDSTGNTGTVPAFNTGVTYADTSTAFGSMTHYAESIVYKTTYPAGVQYQGFDLGALNNIWWAESHPADFSGVAGTQTYGNGHLTVTLDTVNRTVTYTFTNVRTQHFSTGGSLIRSYWTADVDNSTIKWNQVLPFVTTLNSSSGALIGNPQAQPQTTNTVNITVVKPQIKITLTPQNRTLRDINAYAPVSFDQLLGTISINNAGPTQPEDITYTFDFPASPEVRGVNLPAAQTSDTHIIATGLTNAGHTVTYDGTPVMGNNLNTASNNFIALTPQLLGLADGEYLTHLEVTQDTLAVMTYSNLYVHAGISYYGKWVAGQEGDVKLTITDAGDNVLASATDHTKIGWTNSGAGTMTTTVQTPSGNAANTFYPGQTIDAISTYSAGFIISGISNPDTVDPDIYINLPAGIDLDPSSVSVQSPQGNHGSVRFSLQLVGTSAQTIDGVEWTSYHFQVKNKYDILALSSNQNSAVGSFNISYTAIVSSACSAYPALPTNQICQLDLGQTGISSASSADYTVADAANWAVKGVDYMLVGASLSPNISVVQVPGLNVYLGIRPAGSTAPFYTFNGLSSSIAPVSPGSPAEVQLTYQNTADSDYFAGSEIYLPIPKVGTNYDHYFNNADISNPDGVEALQLQNKAPQWTGILTQFVSLPNFTTFYGVDTSGATNYTGAAISATWKPVGMTFYTAAQVTALGIDLANVTMLKFVANVNIPGAVGATASTTFNMDVDSSAGVGQIDYWRSYQKGWTDASGNGSWVYGSVLAAEPARTVQGMFFNDSPANGMMTAGKAFTSLSGMAATLTSSSGAITPVTLQVNADGSFKALDSAGKPVMLISGTYSLAITNANNTLGSGTALGFSPVTVGTSSASTSAYTMNIPQTGIAADQSTATYNFTVATGDSVSPLLVGIGLSSPVKVTFTDGTGTSKFPGSNETVFSGQPLTSVPTVTASQIDTGYDPTTVMWVPNVDVKLNDGTVIPAGTLMTPAQVAKIVPLTDITLMAEADPIIYTITYTLNGGTLGSYTNPSTYTIETPTFSLHDPTKTGYTFDGWTGSNGSTPQTPVTIPLGSTGNKNYVANFTANTYTVHYDPNTVDTTGATLVNTPTGSTANSTHTYDVAKNLTTNGFSVSGYTFSGWNSKADGTGTTYADAQSVVNLTDVNGA
ncbi:MAG: InlB B-repeat-containing protein, partial [Coriobacteriia bacterium]|nr:InlB B-repeat-containing protein [Coriobacteriia bacterium]